MREVRYSVRSMADLLRELVEIVELRRVVRLSTFHGHSDRVMRSL